MDGQLVLIITLILAACAAFSFFFLLFGYARLSRSRRRGGDTPVSAEYFQNYINALAERQSAKESAEQSTTWKSINLATQSPSTTRVKPYQGLSVVGVYLQRRSEDTIKALLVLLLAACVLLICMRIGIIPWIAIIVLFVFICLVWLNNAVFQYRVRSGLFGTNRREALQLIRFIASESKDIDFTDGGKPKKIISDEDLAEVRSEIASNMNGPLPAH